MVLVLITAHIERFSVSRMQDFLIDFTGPAKFCLMVKLHQVCRSVRAACGWDRGIGPMIRIGREIQCLPYAGFFYLQVG